MEHLSADDSSSALISQDTDSSIWAVGTVVEVMPRLWPGINKPGGVARILKVHHDEEDDSILYDVAYIVNNGREPNIEERYVKLHEVESGRRRTHGRCKFCGCFIRDCHHDQSMSMDEYNGMQADLLAAAQKLEKRKRKRPEGEQQARRDSKHRAREESQTQRMDYDEVMTQPQTADDVDMQVQEYVFEDILELPSVPMPAAEAPMQPAIPMTTAVVPRAEAMPAPARASALSAVPALVSAPVPAPAPAPAPIVPYVPAATEAPAPTINDLVSILQSTHRTCSTARSYHEALYYSCTHDSQRMSTFTTSDEHDQLYINKRYNTLLKELSSFSLPVLWEVYVKTHELIVSLSERAGNELASKRKELLAECERLHRELPDDKQQAKQARFDLATAIAEHDDAQERLFKRIERAGFDVFWKVKSKLLAYVKQIFTSTSTSTSTTVWKDIRKAFKQKLEHAAAIVDGISTSFGDVLKVSKKELKAIADTFLEHFGYTVEDVLDEMEESEEDSDYSEYEEEEDVVEMDEALLAVKPTVSKPFGSKDMTRNYASTGKEKSTLAAIGRPAPPARPVLPAAAALPQTRPVLATPATSQTSQASQQSKKVVPADVPRLVVSANDPTVRFATAATVSTSRKPVVLEGSESDDSEDEGNFTAYLAKQAAAAAAARRPGRFRRLCTTDKATPIPSADGVGGEKAFLGFYEHAMQKHDKKQCKSARRIRADASVDPSVQGSKAKDRPPRFYSAAKSDRQCGVFDGRVTFFDRSEDADEPGMSSASVARSRDSWHTTSNLQILSADYHTAHKDKDVRMADDMLAISIDMQFKKPNTAAVPAAFSDVHTVSSALAVDDDVFAALLSSSLDHCLQPCVSSDSAAAVFAFFAAVWDHTSTQSSMDSAAFYMLSVDAKEDFLLAFMKNIYLHFVQEITYQFACLQQMDDSDFPEVTQRLEKLWNSMKVLFGDELFVFYKLKHRPEGVDLEVNYVTQMLTILHKLEAHLLQQCRLFQQVSGLVDAVYSSKAGKVYDLLGCLVCKYLSKKLTFVQTVSSQLTANQGHVDAMKRVRVLVLLQKSVQQVLEGLTSKFLFESELLYGAIAFIRSQPTAASPSTADGFKVGYIHRAEYVLRLFVQAVQVSEKLCKLLFDFANQSKVSVTVSSPGKYWERVTHVLLMAMNKHSDGMTVSKILDYVHGTVDINSMTAGSLQCSAVHLRLPTASTAVGSISTEGIWILLTIFHNMPRLLTNKRRAANGWALVKQLTNQAVKHMQTDMKPAFQNILSISSRLAQLSALWDNSFEGFPIFINMLHGAAPVFQHIQTSSLYNKQHAVPLVDKHIMMRIGCAVHCHSPSNGPGDADLREQLHQQLLFLVSMLLRSSDLENPYTAYLHRILHTGAVPIAQDVLSIGSLDTLRQHCKELLLHAVLDLDGSGKDGIYSQILIRKLKIPVENALKVLKTVFTSVPCYASGLMVLLVIKEVSNLFPGQVAKDWDLANVMMNLIIDAQLLPCLTRAGLDGILSDTAVPVLSDEDSHKQRSCLLFLTALIIFNPFPNASLPTATAAASAVAALSSFDGYLTHLMAFWAAEASDLATLKPFNTLLTLLIAMHGHGGGEMMLTLMQTALASAQCIVHYLHQQMLALLGKQAHFQVSSGKQASSGFRYDLPLPCLPMELCRNYLQLVEVLLVFTKSKGRELASTSVYALSTLLQYMVAYLDILLPLEDMLRGNVDDVQAHPVHAKLIAYAASNRAVMEHVVGQVTKLLPALRQVMTTCCKLVDDSVEGFSMNCASGEGLFYVDLQATCGRLAAQKMTTLTALTAVNQVYGHAISIASLMAVPFDVPAVHAQYDRALADTRDSYLLIHLKAMFYSQLITACFKHDRSMAASNKILLPKLRDMINTAIALLLVQSAKTSCRDFCSLVCTLAEHCLSTGQQSGPVRQMLIGYVTCFRNGCDAHRYMISIHGCLLQLSASKESEQIGSGLCDVYFRAMRHMRLCMFKLSHPTLEHAVHVTYIAVLTGYAQCYHAMHSAVPAMVWISLEHIHAFCTEFLTPLIQALISLLLVKTDIPLDDSAVVLYCKLTTMVYSNLLPHIPFATRSTEWEILLCVLFIQPTSAMHAYLLVHWAVLVTVGKAAFLTAGMVERMKEELQVQVLAGFIIEADLQHFTRALDHCQAYYQAQQDGNAAYMSQFNGYLLSADCKAFERSYQALGSYLQGRASGAVVLANVQEVMDKLRDYSSTMASVLDVG